MNHIIMLALLTRTTPRFREGCLFQLSRAPPPLLIQNFKSTLTTLREQKGMYEVDNASTTQFHRRHIKLDGTISPRDGAQGKEEA